MRKRFRSTWRRFGGEAMRAAKWRKIAVKVVDVFGNDTTRVIGVNI